MSRMFSATRGWFSAVSLPMTAHWSAVDLSIRVNVCAVPTRLRHQPKGGVSAPQQLSLTDAPLLWGADEERRSVREELSAACTRVQAVPQLRIGDGCAEGVHRERSGLVPLVPRTHVEIRLRQVTVAG